jgi:hypothetical protein
MALHTYTPNDGMMGWRCVHCHTENAAHHSQAVIQHLYPETTTKRARTVRLPACSTCGSTVHLKVDFSEAELHAPNMINPDDGSPTPSRQVAERHRQLIQQLEPGAP